MFNLLAHSFPYEDILRSQSRPTDTVFPRPAYIQEAVSKNLFKSSSLVDQLVTSPEDMWDGLDRFSKVQEFNGRLAQDF